MLKLIVLGIVPGTQIQLSFEQIGFALLGFYATLLIGIGLRRKSLRRLPANAADANQAI